MHLHPLSWLIILREQGLRYDAGHAMQLHTVPVLMP